MPWFYLLVAALFEIGWPLGLKMATMPGQRVVGWSLAIASFALSGGFLWLAQREIPMGTAYAVWTGIGAAGTFLVGIALYSEPASALRCASVLLILSGVVGLKLAA